MKRDSKSEGLLAMDVSVKKLQLGLAYSTMRKIDRFLSTRMGYARE